MSYAVTIQEQRTNAAFSKQSSGFDENERENPIIQWMRHRIQQQVLSHLKPNNTLLELNAGTGIDAVFFAQHGVEVHATDSAEGMLAQIEQKVERYGLQKQVRVQCCSFNQLQTLNGNQYDHIFSNFGGLNCAENLASVIHSIKALMKPSGYATLVLMPPICPYEIFSVLKGNTSTAFRRLQKHGAIAHIEGVYFKTFYYSPRYVEQAFGNNFERVTHMGLASFSPPPHGEHLAKRYPRLYAAAARLDEQLSHLPPFRSWADHYLICFRKK